MTKTTLHSDFFSREINEELKEVFSEELLNQQVVIQNKNLINSMIKSLKNYDSNYWSIYYADDFKSIVFQIGEYIVSEIGNGYFSIVVDGIFFDTKDFKYLLQTLNNRQKNIFSDDFNEEFLNLYIYANISNEEADLISSAQNIVLSKVFGATYQGPEHKDDQSLLEYFKIEKTQDTYTSSETIIDEKFLKLLSGETSTLE